MNDTPKTDAFFLKRGSWSEDILAFCRKLERERDEARELAQQMSESNQVLMADVRFYRNAWEQRRDTTL
jgi:hypothetical protein